MKIAIFSDIHANFAALLSLWEDWAELWIAYAWESQVKSTGATVVVTDHKEIPFISNDGNRKLFNPGSIGQPKTGSPDSCYAIWEDGSLELRRYAYPINEAASGIRQMPVSDEVKRSVIPSRNTGGQISREVV